MKKLLIVLGVLVTLLVVAVVVGPGLVDWNTYKGEITSRVKDASGLDIHIDGDLELAILPAPALVVNKVRISNPDGATSAEMVSLKSLQVRVALGPLLSGQMQVQTVRLVEPIIELERYADGRWNVVQALGGDAKAMASPETQPATTPGATNDAGAPNVRLDNFIIENGTVIFRDGVAGSVERIGQINAKVAAASLNGPFDSSGSLVARGFPLSYDITLGNIIEGRTVPVSFTFGLSPEKGRISASGAVTGLDEAPTFKGKFAGDSTRLSDLVHGFTGAGELPGMFGQAFAIQAEIVASAAGADLSELKMTLGNIELTGSLNAEITDGITVAVDLSTPSVNLDDWLAMAAVQRPVLVNSTSQEEALSKTQSNSSVTLNMPAKPVAPGAGSGEFVLPAGIGATIALAADSVTFRGGLVRQARVNVELANGEVTISQLAAQLPGGADVAVFGFVGPVGGKPQFDGQVEVSISDLRGTMDWVGIAPPPVPSDRLRKMTLAGKLKATPQQVQATELDLQFDSSRLTGAATVNLRKRLSFGVNLLLDRINLDAYLVPAKTTAKAAEVTAVDAAKNQPPPVSSDNPIAESLAGLKVLQTFDANIKARIKTLVYGGTSIKGIVFDGTLFDKALNVKHLSIDNVAGSSISLTGGLENLAGIPALKNVRIDGKIADLSRLMRMAGSPPPPEAKSIGAIALKTTLNGSVLKPLVDLDLNGAGATVEANGQLLLMPVIGGFEGKLGVRHKNLTGMLQSFGVDYRPAGKLGEFNLAANVKADTRGLALDGLTVKANPISIQGAVAVAIDGPRPKITANLATGEINLDKLLPVSGTAFLDDPNSLVPAAFVAPRGNDGAPSFRRTVAMSPGKWPTEAIDLSALNAFDADFQIKSGALVSGNYRVENADIVAAVDNGVLRVSRFNGGLFGGVIDANAMVTVARTLQVKTGLTVKNINVVKALTAVTGEAMATGSAEMNLDMTTAGISVAALIAGMNGRGAVALQKLDVKTGGKGTAMSAALGLVAGLNNIGGTLSGNKARGTAADITGSFSISGGVARSNDLRLVSGMGNGRASGDVDLARWLIDIGGQVDLSQNFLSQVLGQGAQNTSVIPFSIKGRLDAPTVKMDTSKLLIGGLNALPGVDKLLKKKGIGSLLQGVLGGGAQNQQPSGNSPPPSGNEPPPPPPPSSTQPQKIKPQDLLKGLLKGLGG